jgi:plastocyanin/heme-degrading monooxygenase HmoA
MEYIQTVLFQIDASRLEEASRAGGLLAELDEHRQFLKQQPGFRDLRITRSINPEGNVLVVVETRWTDDQSLVRYETGDTTVAAIVEKHRDLLVPDTLQVLDMEAIRTDQSWRPLEAMSETHARVVLPIVIPLGVLAFTLLVIYGMSRIYLELDPDVATGLAAAIALSILGLATYFALNPRVPGWQIGAVFVVAAVLLAGGAIWAVSEEDQTAAEEPAVESPGAGTPSGEEPGANTIIMGDNYFEYQGERNPTITIRAGEAVTFTLENSGTALHNMHVGSADGTFAEAVCKPGGEAPCSDPGMIQGGQTGQITLELEPGTYPYRCDFHVDQMQGEIVAE